MDKGGPHHEDLIKTREPWWFVDQSGRRIGWMFPEDMEAIAESIWGARKWVNGLCRYLCLDRTTVDSWRNGSAPIPRHIALLFEMIQDRGIKQRELPKVHAEWLPVTTSAKGRTRSDELNDTIPRLRYN